MSTKKKTLHYYTEKRQQKQRKTTRFIVKTETAELHLPNNIGKERDGRFRKRTLKKKGGRSLKNERRHEFDPGIKEGWFRRNRPSRNSTQRQIFQERILDNTSKGLN